MQGSFSKELQTTVALVREASSLIRTFYRQGVDVAWKGQDDPVTVADRSACELLVKGLSKAFPEDSVLSEELPMLNKGSKRVWFIDPLDGTREFIEGIDEFAVMVGLCVEGRPVLGVVDQPAVGLLFYAEKGSGAWSEQDGRVQALRVSSVASPSQMTLAVSRSHRDPRVEKVMAGLNITREIASGSVGVKCGLLMRGQADAYVHPSRGIHVWDTCGPEALLTEAGGIMTDCQGNSLWYDPSDSRWRNGLLASNGRIHDRLVQETRLAMETQA